MGKKIIEPKTSKPMESKSLKIMEPNSSKIFEAKNSSRKLKKKVDPFTDEIPTREFCPQCNTPSAKKPVFNQFNLPVETTTTTASCQVQSCYITVTQVEATVKVPKRTSEDLESIKASLTFDMYPHRKKRRSKTLSQHLLSHHKRQEEQQKLAEYKKKMEHLMGFTKTNISNTKILNLERVGPHWYQELSNKQLAYMDVLECALVADWEEGVFTRLHRILAGIGILPRPTERQVSTSVQLSYLNPVLFLAYLYKLTTVRPWDDFHYSVNGRILLSGLAYLAIPRTLMDLEWRIPFHYPKLKCNIPDVNTTIPALITRLGRKTHPHLTSPYVEPLPYFVHRLRFEKEIIASKQEKIRRARMLPPAPRPAFRPPTLQRKVSIDSEPKMSMDNSQVLTTAEQVEKTADTQSQMSTESTASKPIVKISSSGQSTRSGTQKSARFKIDSGEKISMRSSDPPAIPKLRFNPEDEEEVEIRQLGPDSVCGMEHEKEKNDEIQLNHPPPTREKSKEEVLQINKKRSRQVKADTSETSKASELVAATVPEPETPTQVSVPSAPVEEPQRAAVEDPVEEVKVRLASNTVFGTLEQVYSIAMTRIDETTAHGEGTKASEQPVQEGKKKEPCLCAEELKAEKLIQESSATAEAEQPATSETAEQGQPAESTECQAAEKTSESDEQADSVTCSCSSDSDTILTEQAIAAVLNGYWLGYHVGHEDEETENKATATKKKKQSLDKSLKDALATMGQEGNILAALPHSNKLPAIVEWLKYRKGHMITKETKDQLLRHSKAQWDIQRLHARKVRVPHLKFKGGHLDWSHKNSVVKKVEKVYLKYYADVRQALVDDAREFWPPMQMQNFYNPYFKDVFFAYLSSKEEDCVQTRLVF